MNLWNTLKPLQRLRGGDGKTEPPPQIDLFGGIAQERVYVGLSPQAAPEQPRQGDTPARWGRMPIAVLTGINPQAVAEGRFVAGVLDAPPPHASYPLTRQLPERQRVNIPVPPHVALGSMFSAYAGY